MKNLGPSPTTPCRSNLFIFMCFVRFSSLFVSSYCYRPRFLGRAIRKILSTDIFYSLFYSYNLINPWVLDYPWGTEGWLFSIFLRWIDLLLLFDLSKLSYFQSDSRPKLFSRGKTIVLGFKTTDSLVFSLFEFTQKRAFLLGLRLLQTSSYMPLPLRLCVKNFFFLDPASASSTLFEIQLRAIASISQLSLAIGTAEVASVSLRQLFFMPQQQYKLIISEWVRYSGILDCIIPMFGSFATMLNKLKNTQLAQNISDNYHKITDKAKQKHSITPIAPNLFHIDYPDQDNYSQLIQHIGEAEFEIWNISEYPYDKQLEARILQNKQQGQLHHLCFEYYSNLPLYELIIALNSIHAFLALNPNNRVYVHCQDNKIRSGVFLTCLLYKFHMLNLQDLSQCILYVNKQLSVNLEVGSAGEGSTEKYNNLHVFFKNFVNFINNPAIINQYQLELLKIVVNQAPRLQLPKQKVTGGGRELQLKVAIQIRCRQQVVFKGIYESSVFVGQSLCLQLAKKHILLTDDFLVMLKYIYQGKIYNIVRMQLNTNFIYDGFYRSQKQGIDLSAYCVVSDPTSMFIDFMFEQTQHLSHLANLDLSRKNIQKAEKKLESKSRPEQKEKSNPVEQQKRAKEQEQKREQVQKAKMQNFSLNEHEEERLQVDENEINRKIEEVIKNISKKEPQEDQEQPPEDLEDYLSKLESQI